MLKVKNRNSRINFEHMSKVYSRKQRPACSITKPGQDRPVKKHIVDLYASFFNILGIRMLQSPKHVFLEILVEYKVFHFSNKWLKVKVSSATLSRSMFAEHIKQQ